MRIGISYWGFCEGFKHSTVSNTPDGHRFGRPLLIDALLVKGHKVLALQSRRENERYRGISYNNDSFPDLDVLFLEWRWPTYKNSGAKKFEGDLDRQLELLDYYHGKIPIIAWDTDLKMTIEDEQRWPEMIVADPSLDPKKLSRERIRLTFWSDFRSLLVPSSELAEFGYVGNNYERDDMFQKYYSVPAKALREHGIQTKVHGNWLQRSPERISPESLIKKHTHIAFGKRLSFQGSMHVLNELICTIHITKPEYAKRGFTSPRYVENLAVGTPALVPSEFKFKKILGKKWVVSNSSDVIAKVKYLSKLSLPQRKEIIQEQAHNMLKLHNFSVDNVVSLLESLNRI